MRIKNFTSLILSFIIGMPSFASAPSAMGNGGRLAHADLGTSSNAPMVSTTQQREFCNNVGRLLSESANAGTDPNFRDLENEILNSNYGQIGIDRIRQMLQSMNAVIDRGDIAGTLHLASRECLNKLRSAGVSGVANELGARLGGITAIGATAVSQNITRIDEIICKDVNFNSNECDTDQNNHGIVSSLAQNGQNIASHLPTQGTISASSASPATPNACECAALIVTSSPEKSGMISDTRAQLTGLIQDRLNKKFINSYAQNREDLQFLMAHRGNVFGSNESEQNRNAERLICNQSTEFQSFIASRCNSVPPEELNLRQQALFRNLETLGSSATSSIENHWQNLENQIRSMPFPEGVTVPSGHLRFDRPDFDKIRNGLSRNEPSVSTLGQFLTNIINSSDFKNSVYAKKTPRPYDNIRAYLGSLQTRPDFNNIKTLLTKDTPEHFLTEFESNPSASFDNVMGLATGIHPGLRIALSEGKVFQKLLSIGGDALDAIDNNRSVLYDEHLKDSCNRIKNDYANALCNTNSDLISRVNNKEMDDLLGNQDIGISIDVAKHILCTTEKKKDNMLDLLISEPKSSLLSRISGESDFMGEIMRQFIDPNNDDIRKYLVQVSTIHDPSSRSITSPIVQIQNGYSSSNGGRSSLLDYISEDGSVSNTLQNNGSSFVSTTQSSSAGTTPDATVPSNDASTKMAETTIRKGDADAFVPSSSSYSNAKGSTDRTPASVTDLARSQLSDSISNPENRAVVNDLVSQVDNQQIQELTRLRDEARRSAQLMSELTNKAHLDRIKALEDQIKNIETQRQAAIAQTPTPQPTPTQRALVPESEFSVARSASELSGRDVASVAQAQVGGAGGGSSILGNLQSTLSSAMNGNTNSNGSSEISPLVITSNIVKATSPDLSQEVLRFLETEPDLSSLTQIKESGLLYRFKVVRDGKETVEELLIQFDRLSPEARGAIDAKIATRRNSNPSIERLETELANVKRTHSYESLRMIIGQQAQSHL